MKVFQNVFGATASQVYVGCFSAHRMKEYFLVALLWQACNLNRIRIWRESANYPSANRLLERIMRPHGVGNSFFIVRIAVAAMVIEPCARRWDHLLCFPCDAASFPFRDRYKTLLPKAA